MGIKEFDKDHIQKTKQLKSFLSSTTYSIGRKTSPADDHGFMTPRVFTSSHYANLNAMKDKPTVSGVPATPQANKDWVNPNLIESLEFKSPNAEPKDVFSTTTLGYTKAIKATKIDYKKKVEDEKQHRLRMRRLVLDPHFEYGFDPNNNCPSNEEMVSQGIPKWEAPLTFDKHQYEENKQLAEK